jgi:hypothetical protein
MISRLGLARQDIDRLMLSSSIQNNWVTRTLGSMMLRPGYGYIGSTNDDDVAFHIPFIYANDDTAIIELTDQIMRVRVSEAVIQRGSVSSAVSNGNFDTDLSGWTDADESGSTSAWATGGYMSLIGTRYNAAIRRQQVTVAGADQNDEHALRVIVERGPVTIKVGSSSGGEQYIAETSLGAGNHSLAFTPTGDFHIELSSRAQAAALVTSINVESSGDMELPTPWLETALPLVRYEQSGDVIYVAVNGYAQYKILRYGTRSWSIVKYQTEDGPFRAINTTTTRITPSGLTGDITLTASRSFFTSAMVGGLMRITSVGQNVSIDVTGAAQWSDPIRVTGVGSSQRSFTITRAGTWSGTVTLQRSVGEVGSWIDVTTYTTNASISYPDGLDNQIVYYRIGIDTGDYTSGTAELDLAYSSGGLTGVARITAYSSATSVSAAVLTAFGAITASEDWEEGEWSDRRGYPSCVVLHEGRLFWGGKSKIWGSVSDAYESFDDETEGDSAPISKTLGKGPVDVINWLISAKRLLMGAQGAEWTARSSSLDEPLTQTNSTLKDPTNNGSAAVAGLKVDGIAAFVHKSTVRLFQSEFSLEKDDFAADDLTKLIPEIAESGITRLALQRQPDTRIHCVLGNGRVAILVLDSLENVKCWITVSTDGLIEDAFVLPGSTEDSVYYVVKRTINGSTKRYLEKWAMESECKGGTYIYDSTSSATISVIVDDRQLYTDGTLVTARDASGVKIGNYTVTAGAITLVGAVTYAAITPTIFKLADSYITYSGVSTATITGLSHLEGESVVAWGDGKDLGTYTVASGQITLSEAVTNAMVGLAYTAKYKSVKLGMIDRSGTPLTQPKIINQLGVILSDSHPLGLQYGTDFENMDDMPLVEDGAEVDEDAIWDEYDKGMFPFDGTWSSDSRLCLQANAPRPCNILAAIIGTKLNEKNSRDNP